MDGDGEETNKWVLEKIRSVWMLEKSMAERKMRFFDRIVRQKRYDSCKGRRNASGEEADQDLKEWTKLDIAAASQLATDRERWREIIKVTVADSAI